MATGGLWLRLLGKSARRKGFNSSSAPFVSAWRGGGEGAEEPQGKMKFKSLQRRTPLGDSLPFLKREKSVTWFFLCLGVEKFGKCLQSTGGAASASPPAAMLPSIARWLPLPMGDAHRRVSLGVLGCETGGCCHTWWICITGPVSCAHRLNASYAHWQQAVHFSLGPGEIEDFKL